MRPFIVLVLLLAAAGQAAAQDPVYAITAVHGETGAPLANVLIVVRQVETGVVYGQDVTNERGQVSIRVAPLQWYEVRAVTPGYTSPRGESLSPATGTISFDVTLDLPAPRLPLLKYGTISGHVLGPDGEPLPRLSVIADSLHDGAPRAVTEEDGSFRIEAAVGSYTVRTTGSHPYPPFYPLNTIPPVYDVYGPGEVAGVTVAADRETAGVTIYLARERRYRARVTVVGEGAPVSEGHVEWHSSSGTGSSARITDGVADIGPLAPGPFVITAIGGLKPSQVAGTTTIEIVDQALDDVVVNVFPGGRASGRVVGPDGRPIARPASANVIADPVGWRGGTSTGPDNVLDRDGRFLLTGLTGERCLEVLASGFRVTRVTHGGTDYTGRPFSFEPGREISGIIIQIGPGTVFRHNGRPASCVH